MKKNILAFMLTLVLAFSASFCSMAASINDPVVAGESFTLKDVTPESIEFCLYGLNENDCTSFVIYKLVTPGGTPLVVYITSKDNGGMYLYCAPLTQENMVKAKDFYTNTIYNYKTDFFNVTDAVDYLTGAKLTFSLEKYTDNDLYELHSRKIQGMLLVFPIDSSIDQINYLTGAIQSMEMDEQCPPFEPIHVNSILTD